MMEYNLILLSWFLFTGIQLVFLLIIWINSKTVKNLQGTPIQFPKVSILVPMRNESAQVNRVVEQLTRQNYPNFEILMLDDHSEDDTWLKMISQQWIHPEILLYQSDPLPERWLGKNHACHQLAKKAHGEILIFMDADVLPSTDSILNSVAALEQHRLDFLSVFPEQMAQTPYQKKILPQMEFFLYSFLPFPLITRTKSPSFAAANGQWMVFTRKAYELIGGHEQVKNKVIEDMALARKIKSYGLKMDTFSGLDKISCQMYASDSEMKAGFGKNIFAAAGYSSFKLITFLSFLFLIFISPYIWFIIYPLGLINILIILLSKAILSKRFKHPVKETVWMHPFSLLEGIGLAWNSLQQYKNGEAGWKGRKLSTQE